MNIRSKVSMLLLLSLASIFLLTSVPLAQEEEQERPDPSQERLFGFGGQLFIPSLTVAFLDGRLWPSPTFGLEGGLGAISIPLVATFPVFMGRALFKFIDQATMDFYVAGGLATVLAGGGPVFFCPPEEEICQLLTGQWTSYLVQVGMEFSLSTGMAGNAEIGLVIGGGGFRIVAAGGLHFYLRRPGE